MQRCTVINSVNKAYAAGSVPWKSGMINKILQRATLAFRGILPTMVFVPRSSPLTDAVPALLLSPL